MRDESWHALSTDETCRRLDSDLDRGLSPAEAQARLARLGPNALPEKPAKPAWRLFLDQFKSLLTLVLLAAGVLAGLIGDTTDMAVIVVVVLFNSCLGFYQEHRAEKILDALRGMLAQQSRVCRDGEKQEIQAEHLVRGDLVLLEAGDRVPADGRLVVAHGLEIDESSLTGESQAVGKDTAPLPEPVALADRANQAFMNTVVTRGRGEMLVTATGPATEMGRIAGLLHGTPESGTPLQRRLDQLGRTLSAVAGVVVAVILVMGLARGEPLAESVMTAVALAVAAIPEGLPAVVTVTLAIGMARMARKGAIVKKLAAVETLGSTTVIASDKTGTLTLNQMTARAGWAGGRRFRVEGEGYACTGRIRPDDPLGPLPDLAAHLRAGALCNDAQLCDDGQGGRTLVGDPTEGALRVLAGKAGADAAWPRVAELPFDSARKLMLTVHRDGERLILAAKGAPDVVIDYCRALREASGDRPLTADDHEQLRHEVERLGARALRVLALAEAEVDEAALADPLAAARGRLVLTALVGLMDPPRPSAHDAVADCRRAGIAVKMITGDHRVTAAAIGRALGLDGEVVTGAQLDAMDDAALAARIDGIAVFARVAPEHKVRIVAALRARGHVVAMTGDGVNDAAALKRADIGVAMGRAGTDVTREAATMVLTDDDFSTVVHAVQEGRTIYDNIIKFVRFQLSTNVGALLAVFAAPLIGMPIPFHPIQILWVNIIMDGPPALALAFDPPRAGLMREHPRDRDEAILSRTRLLRLLATGITMAAGTLGMLWWALAHDGDATHARTLAFTTFVMFQVFNVFNARVAGESVVSWRLFANRHLWLALVSVLALQALAVHWPLAQSIFHTAPLALSEWALAAAVASSVLVLDESRKLLARWRRQF